MQSSRKKLEERGIRMAEFSPSSPFTLGNAMATAEKRGCASTPSYRCRANLPSGDSPYVRAKRVQLVDKDPDKAVALFWSAINSGDRVDSAVKDMAVVMKQVNRAEEAIEAIKSFRHLCSNRAQESLDNVLIDLYKKCGRKDEELELLKFKLSLIEAGEAFVWRTAQFSKSKGKKYGVSISQEKARLLGNIAWLYLQSENYKEAEQFYRKALELEPDYNRLSNLAVCLMWTGRIPEAKSLLQEVKEASIHCNAESFMGSFLRASKMLVTLESQSAPESKKEVAKIKVQNVLPSSGEGFFNGGTPNSSNSFHGLFFPSSLENRKEFVNEAVTSVSDCNSRHSKSSTLLTTIRKDSCFNGHAFEASANNHMLPLDGILDMKSRDDSRSFITENYKVEENSLKPGSPIQSPAAVWTSKTTASRTSRGRRKSNKKFNVQRKNLSGSPRDVSTAAEESMNILAGDAVVAELSQFPIGHHHLMSEEQIVLHRADGSAVVRKPNGQCGSYLNALINGKCNSLSESLLNSSQRCMNSDKKELAFHISASATENKKPVRDPSVIISGKGLYSIYGEEKYNSVENSLELNKPMQTPPEDSVRGVTADGSSTRANMNFNQRSNLSRDDRFQTVPPQNPHSVSASITEKQTLKVDSSTLASRKKTWADMVEEEEKEEEEEREAATLNSDRSPSANNTIRNVLESAAQHRIDGDKKVRSTATKKDMTAPVVENSSLALKDGRRTWADLVEEEEGLASENSCNATAIDCTIGSCKGLSKKHLDKPAYIGRSQQQPAFKYSDFLRVCEDSEIYADENMNINIDRSATPQIHRLSHNHNKGVYQNFSSSRRNGSARRSLSFSQHSTMSR